MSQRQFRRARQREMERDRRRTAPRIGAAGAALAGAIVFAPAADAATFNVTNLNNDGAGSLRDAVEQANAAPGDDVVTFQSGLSGTIELAGADSDIEIYEDGLDIQGPGASAITVDGNGLDRVFFLSDFQDADTPVRISGLTLTGGSISGGYLGGALYSDTGGNSPGPGDYAAELTIADSLVSGNDSYGGGAIWTDYGSVTITNSTLAGNDATTGGGGALYANDTDGDQQFEVVIRNSTVTGNSADERGGGIKFEPSDVSGAGILIEGSTISQNAAGDYGGGVEVFDEERLGDIVIRSSTIAGNRADRGGGGVQLWQAEGTVLIENSTISGNVADSDGNGSGYGGGIASYNDEDEDQPRTIRNTTVTGNSAAEGGGIQHDGFDNPATGDDILRLSSTIVAGNTATDEGPDLWRGTPEGAFEIGFSLIGSTADSGQITESPAGTNLTGVDPQLGPLANNGGPTQTHAPSFTSPVLDKGIGNGVATDQRGAPRTFDAANLANAAGGDGTDIGAVELLPGGRLSLAQCKGATENVLFAPGTAIVGTDANDVIVGTDANDSINSGKGKDKVCAGAGNDGVKAGSGKDNVAGQAGKDRLKGNGGNDKLQGNAGKDTLKGGGGKDTLKGGGGKDKLRGGPGRDKLRGGGGKDSEQQ